MKKVFIFLFASILLGLISSQEANAQLSYSYTFAATGTSGWTGQGSRSTAAVCATTGSIRYNLYSGATTMNFVSPALNSSQGSLVTLSYQTKCVTFSNTAVGATANSVTTKVQYSNSSSGPWTDVSGSSFGNTTATTCTTRTVTFTPAAGTFYVRFNSTWAAGDVYLYLDEISITAPAPPACSGTPAPGNTISSVTSVCSGVNFNLSMQNAITGSGLTYQWQSADDVAFTTNVTNLGTGTTQTTSSTTSKYYRCGVTCSGTTGYSTPVLVNIVNNPALCAPYCVPVGSCTYGDLIASVTLNTLVNVSGTTCNGDYWNYTSSTNPNFTTTLLPSSTYNCIVGSGAYAQDYAAWIDYNDDGTFATTERIGYTTSTLAANATASFPITLACTPPAGPHRLRVRSAYNTAGSAITPCSTQTYGETEDYLITIAAPPVCPDLGALSVVSTTHNTANLSWVLNCANATAWDVQYGPTGFTLGNGTIVSNIPGTSTATVTGLTPLTAYQFYVRANCGAVTSNWSLVAAGTTLAAPCAGTPVTAVAVAPSAICASSSLALTSTGLSTDAGLTYQWESSTDSISWTPIAGATSSSHTIAAGITVNTWYRLITTCTNSALTSTSNEVGVKINPFYNCYAASTASNTANEEILGVTLNSISNTSTCSSVGPGPGSVLNLYSNYRTLGALTNLEQGGGYPITLDLGSCAGNFARSAKVWIDYNRNGVFENPGEMVYSTGDIAAATVNPTTNTGTVLVPISAGIGLTGMRVSYFETTAASVVPTGTPSIYGEVEDYLVNITQLNSVITSVSPTSACANVGTLTITGSGLYGATAVSVGGTPVLSYTVNSPNQITAIVGSGTDGVVSVTVNGVTISGVDVITVLPSPIAPTVSAATATVNFGESTSFTASGTETIFNWYTTATGGSPIYTGATFNTPGVCTNTTFYADQSSATCVGPRTPVSVVVQPVALMVSPANGLICSAADSATLSVTNINGATYAWNNSLTGASITVSPPTTTIYSVTVTSSTCITTLTKNIGVISGVNLMPTVASSDFCYPNQTTDSIFSNLSAGNFGVSNISYGPSTQPATGVTTLATGGTASVPLSGGTLDDGGWGNIPIGFNYNFFGSAFTTLGVGTNGLVMFGPIPGYSTTAGQLGQFSFASPAFPNTGNPGNVIGLMLSDMHFGQANTSLRYWTEGIAPTRTFVLSGTYAQYTAAASGGALTTVQLKLFETTGIVEVHIASSAATTARTVGLQDATKTIGAIAPGWNGRTTTLTTPQAIRFSPPANYTYAWSTGNSDITPVSSNLSKFEAVVSAPGSYSYDLAVTNPVTGCTINGQVSFNANPMPEVSLLDKSNVTCNGGNNGWATVSVSNGTDPYTYSWAPTGGNSATATGLTAGEYTVTVTDASLCSSTTIVTINQPSIILPTIVSTSSVSCNGGNNGSAEIAATGGTGNYTYSWSPAGGTSNIASGLSAGVYTVTVTDDSLCAQTITVSITQPSALAANVNSITNVSCFGGADGSVSMSVSGGTAPYTYSWSPAGGTDSTASGLSAGNYTFTVTDANNCESNTVVTITEPTLLTVSINTTSPLCAGSNGGSATALVNGGTPSYTYSWSQSGNTASVNNLSAGSYSVTVTDSKLCTAVSSLTIQDPIPMSISVENTTNVTCHGGNNGAATILVSGGVGTISYNWLPSGGNASSAAGLIAGIYTVVVTDANLCTGTVSVLIFEPAPFTASISASTPVSCYGLADASATVSTSGGQSPLNYMWSPIGGNASTAYGLPAGHYTVTVTDATLCTATTVISFQNPTAVSVDLLQLSSVSCFGGSNGSIDFSATGGSYPYTYSWSPSVSTTNAASGLNAGSYQVTVTDNNGCSATSSAIVDQPNLLEASISNSLNVSCLGGSNGAATVSAIGGTSPYNYAWSPSGGSSTTAIGLSAGAYTVTITDANNCSSTTEVTINDGNSLALTASSTNPACNGENGQLDFLATGGTGNISYSVNSNLASSPMQAPDGSYTIVATDANGCSAQSQLVIVQPDLLVLSTNTTNPTCNGGSSELSFNTTGGTGTINVAVNSNLAISPLSVTAGSYAVVATDANGCSAQDFVNITEPTAIIISASTIDALCNGGNGSIAFNAIGGTGNLYYDVNGLVAISPLSGNAGIYTITVSDDNACTASATITIAEPALVTLTATTTDALCNAGLGNITFSAAGGTSPIGLYVDGINSFSPYSAGVGTYLVEAIDANGCSISTTVSINEPAPLQLTASSTDALCNGGTGTISFAAFGGTGNIAITVNGNLAPSPFTGAPGTYTIVATDANGCSAETTIDIAVPLPITLLATVTNALCFGSNGSIDFFAYGGIGTIVYEVNGTSALSPQTASSGIYTITATDDNGCSAQTMVTVNNPTELILSASATDALCNGANGSIQFNSIGGTGNILISINGASAVSPSNLSAGTYTVLATDANGCTSQSIVSINEPTTIALNVIVTNATCNGALGSLSYGATGGSGTVSITIDGSLVSNPFNAAAGSYNVVATDANGCSVQTTAVITEQSAVLLTATGTNPLCNGSNGSIDFAATGGFGTISYSVNGNAATSPISASNGTYSVLATDANGCTSLAVVNIYEPGAVAMISIGASAICYGNNGALYFAASGGTGTIAYTVNGVPASSPYSQPVGTYTVVASDANGCSVTTELTITQPDLLVLTASSTDALCNNGNGFIYMNTTGGSGGIQFSVNGNAAVSPWYQAAGTYTVIATDAGGCTASTTVTVNQPSALTLSAGSTDALCNGDNGSINFTVGGGTGTITVYVNGTPAATNNMSVPAGTYFVTAVDANGCSVYTSVTVNAPNPVTVTASTTNALCFGGTGTLTFNATGGSGTFSYLVNNVPATSNMLAPAGYYVVTAIDANGCSANSYVNITEPNAIYISANVIDATCNGGNGAINILASGGTGTITYTINGSSAGNNTSAPAGTYTIVATDANGCSAQTIVVVSQPTALSLSASSTDALCNGGNGSLSFNATGGTGTITYSVNGSSATSPTANPAGTYTIVATDINGCTSQTVLIISQPTPLSLNMPYFNATCYGGNGQIHFNATGGVGTITYTVNGVLASSPHNVPAGTYTVVATDANGCSTQSVATIMQPNALSLSASSTDALCNGSNGSLSFNATGGTGTITYSVNGSSATSPTASPAGNYTIVATDVNGCTSQTVLIVSQPSAISLSASSTDATCYGGNGSINFSAGGGTGAITYTVNGSSATNNMAAPAGTYTVVATDANGCSAQTIVVVSQPTALVLSATANNALCNGSNGSLSFNATGGTGSISYTINGTSAASPASRSAGTYTIVATDANACSAQTVLTITQPSVISLTAGSTDATCYGGNGSINFSAGGGTGAITYTVNGSSATNNMAAPAGTYTVVATDANGCSAQTSVVVSQPTALVLSATANNALCNGSNGSLSFNATGGTGSISYTINGTSAASPASRSAGTYTIVATDANACSAQTVLTITQPSVITLTAGSTNAACYGGNGSINFSAGGGTGAITYTVNGSSATNNMAAPAGTYTIVATDANGCSAQTSVVVSQPTALVLSATANNALCNGSNGSLSFNATGGTGSISYTINGTSAASPASRPAGNYTIVATDANGCSAQTILTISQPSAVTLIATGTNALCNGTTGSISFNTTGGTGAITTTVNGTPTISPASVGAGTYTITATDINNCSVQTSLTISVPSAINLTASATNVVCAGGNGSLTFGATGGSGNKVFTVNGIVRNSPFNTTAGTYTIVATDANGCSTSTVRTISTINALPTVSLGADVMICQGGSTNLNLAFTGNSPWVYAINGGAPQIAASNLVSITVNPISSTQYIITSLSDATCSTTITDSVWVNTQPCGNLMPLITSSLNYTVTYKISSQPYATTATNSPTSFTATGLPVGLSMANATGIISGTATDLPGVYPVQVSAINQYGSDTKTLMITVSPRQLTISGLSVISKVYDATTQATLSGTPALVGRATGDIVNLTGTPMADFNNSQVGTAKPVAVSGYSLSGTHAAYYTLTQPTLSGNITGRPATVNGLTAGSKVYDGITNTTIIGTPVAVGLVAGDAVSLNTFGAAANFVTPAYGYNKPVNFSGYSLVGTSASNYIFSQPASVVADIICASPSILSIVPTGNQATITWTGGALNYTLEYRPTGTVTWTAINTTSTTYTVTGLTPSTTYEVRLKLSCVTGVFSNYVSSSFTTTSGCSIPTLTAPVVYGNSAKLNWNGSADSIYQVTYRLAGTLSWGANINQTVKTRTYTGLTINTTYEYRVRSICKNGDISVWVNGQFTTTSGCGLPTLNTPLPYGNSAKVSWSGAADSIYQVSVKPSSSLVWGAAVNTSTLNRTITGLTVNTAYDYQVRSICKNGDISNWVVGQFTTTSGCGIPSLNAPTAISGNSATANWTGTSDSIYQISFKPTSSATWSSAVNTNLLSRKLTGLLVNTTYDYQVRSICKSGDASVWVTGQFTTNAGCGLPILNAPTAINGNSATVNWTSLSDSVHQISFKPATSATWSLPGLATGTSKQLTGLTVNTVYNYRLRSICKNGDISDWVVGSFTTNAGCPIVTLNTPVVSSTSAVISWTNVSASSYSADFYSPTYAAWFTLGNNSTTSRTIYGLLPNTTYQYRVRSSCSNADMSAYVTGTFTTSLAKDNNTAMATLFNVNGTLNEEGMADLSWSSLSEWQVSAYEIEHRVGDNPFMPLVTIPSKAIDGNSNDILDYQTLHTSPAFGLNQYRIWILGIDGSRTLHNEVIGLRKSPFETIVSAYPNPASSEIHLTVKTDKTHPVDIKFLDATGRTIKAMSVSVQAGNNDIPVDINALPVAMYTMAVYREGVLVFTGRFQKMP